MDPTPMTSDHQFWISIATLIMSGILSIVTAVIAYLTAKTRTEVKDSQTETRFNIGELAKSVNGVKSEIVAITKDAAMQEGALLEASRGTAAANRKADARFAEVALASKEATEESVRISKATEEAILKDPKC